MAQDFAIAGSGVHDNLATVSNLLSPVQRTFHILPLHVDKQLDRFFVASARLVPAEFVLVLRTCQFLHDGDLGDARFAGDRRVVLRPSSQLGVVVLGYSVTRIAATIVWCCLKVNQIEPGKHILVRFGRRVVFWVHVR